MSRQDETLLELEQLRVYFQGRGRWVHAVDGISLAIKAKEGVTILGESGSGKTLTMMSTLALIPPNPGVVGGQIRYFQENGEIVSLLDDVEGAYRLNVEAKTAASTWRAEQWYRHYQKRARLLAGRHIGIIFQNPIDSLDPLWTVGATLRESIRLRDPKFSRVEVEKEALAWLDRVHIKNPEGVMRAYPHQLSGGMCQRVMIAATLAMRPRLIIADEPTTGLDMTTKAQVLFLLREARDKYGSALIFVTHEIGLATGLTERVVVMKKGHVVDEFPTAHLSDVRLEDGRLQSAHDFAPHTRELLYNSLRLEGPRQAAFPTSSLVDA